MNRLKLREDLRKRFRLEYLSHLRQNMNKIRKADGIKVGEIVLIENKNLKRLYWPLGRVTEIFPGKDGVTRLVKVKTASGEKLRPVQRLYSLEINAVSSEPLRHRALKGTRRLSQSMEKNLRNKIADPVKSKVDNQLVLNQKTRLGREIKTVKRLDL
ncbi:reverse transcriptase [Caerostris extrusa]|uniref:Reverse transcriptase n=1 Tax=Caerostris extrusa TaxID=172846 RepID=A0AAV4TC43_CAEEX|nr:reverse transcriptase [Caerostris extrusa]